MGLGIGGPEGQRDMKHYHTQVYNTHRSTTLAHIASIYVTKNCHLRKSPENLNLPALKFDLMALIFTILALLSLTITLPQTQQLDQSIQFVFDLHWAVKLATRFTSQSPGRGYNQSKKNE